MFNAFSCRIGHFLTSTLSWLRGTGMFSIIMALVIKGGGNWVGTPATVRSVFPLIIGVNMCWRRGPLGSRTCS
jgi:hypothetical protein